ncbi:MAG TPA: MBL fold metallo-hydrolase [Thermoanaerobaculia bacterium]|nr:MBL fold metallo-hydrolase [Thermoanaerobaculia bacterium]
MSSAPVVLRTRRLTIEGKSRAGNETWFRVRELGLALDIGRCPDPLVGLHHVFITHAHLDHALGVPYYAAQRRLYRLGPGSVYVPAETLEQYRELMALHERMEGIDYPIDLIGLAPGQTRRIRKDLLVRAHRATHRVPANAWELCEMRHKLRADLADRSGEELAKMRAEGVGVEEWIEKPILFYTGDTDRRILEQSEALFEAEVLMIECSFTGEGEEERGRRYAHIHLTDLWEFADRFRNETIILTHFSLRDSPAEIHRRIAREVPPALRERILLALPEPHSRV